jgi:hypothetical protein
MVQTPTWGRRSRGGAPGSTSSAGGARGEQSATLHTTAEADRSAATKPPPRCRGCGDVGGCGTRLRKRGGGGELGS